MNKRIILLSSFIVFVLFGCANQEREIDNSEVDHFIEELSKHFEVEEEPEVFVSSITDKTTYYLDDFAIELFDDRELSLMYLVSDKEKSEKLINFFGLTTPENFESLEPGNSVETVGEYVLIIINREDNDYTERKRKQAEEDGRYYDEREDYSTLVYFLHETEEK